MAAECHRIDKSDAERADFDWSAYDFAGIEVVYGSCETSYVALSPREGYIRTTLRFTGCCGNRSRRCPMGSPPSDVKLAFSSNFRENDHPISVTHLLYSVSKRASLSACRAGSISPGRSEQSERRPGKARANGCGPVRDRSGQSSLNRPYRTGAIFAVDPGLRSLRSLRPGLYERTFQAQKPRHTTVSMARIPTSK